MVTLRLICCNFDEQTQEFPTWEEADAFRDVWMDSGGKGFYAHRRAAIISRVTTKCPLCELDAVETGECQNCGAKEV